MTENLTYKLLRTHLAAGELRPGQDITVRVDQILLEDATGTMAAMQFEELGLDEIQVPLAVTYVDHNVLQIDDKNMQDHAYLRTFSARYGLRYSPAGHGISHYIHLERFSRPGELLLGADSHTSTAGASGMFAIGAGGLEVAVAMGGYGFDFVCPRTVGVELTGKLRYAVEPKDVVLELLRRYGVRGGIGSVFEFYGLGVESLSTTARATIANMIIETGASTAVFPSDRQTQKWLTEQGRPQDFVPLCADAGAHYDEHLRIDLSELKPLIAVPHSPGNVIAVAELPHTPVSQVCVGSSVNSSYDDLATVAAALRGHTVDPRVQLTVTPGSRQILDTIIRSGVYQDLMDAGARMLEPICGPCVGIGQAPLRGAASLRTFNRNFPGRSGTAEDNVYLCSPSTAAASALAGRITDPSGRQPIRPRPAVSPDATIHERHITSVLPPERRSEITVDRGPNLVSPPIPIPPEDDLKLDVLIEVPDDVSTGDMAPDGAIAMSVWSNIAECARFMFTRFDREFYRRAMESPAGAIVAGHNYGQGSSREHAALVPVHLGVRVVAARSYARIHRRNLIAVGIVPLVIPDSFAGSAGGRWEIHGLNHALAHNIDSVAAVIDGDADRLITFTLDLTAAERAVLLAGGLLAYVRAGGRTRVEGKR
ncbi:aconitate hydratase [Mycolicibacterium peregrinum]|uniref:aconitate hydratase n=1 Tax=Mycolicibacterium peregrinum TaxID=43304 RepID=UPI0006D76B46|nr:aconitate hydratase [Mycolicibacterium peregrinum]MCV7203824.1 aconitate hydratase [Mycolicibacterium peregrinum]ORW58194.1 aconitate hydratase [Mycolicibacterium peregrinum]